MQKSFSTEVVGSIYSGMLLCQFGDLHEAIEALAGGPVWTHHLPKMVNVLAPRIAEACPALAAFDYSGVTPENYEAERTRLIAECGAAVDLPCPLIDGHKPGPLLDLPRKSPK